MSLPDILHERSVQAHQDLQGLVDRAISAVLRASSRGELASDEPSITGFTKRYQRKLALLQDLVEAPDACIVPALDPAAPRGHAYREVEELLELPPGGGLDPLEQMAELGLLERQPHNRIHLCPRCQHCHVNFRETCPACGSIELELERLITHFHCAYSGVESEFVNGLELSCPKCRKGLEQIGQDFERPSDIYLCHASEHVFEEPEIEAQCLHCEHVFAGSEVEVARIWRYRPTTLAVRAVELGRMTGLDVETIMYDARLMLVSFDFMQLEIKREIHRIRRYQHPFVTALLHFEAQGEMVQVFQELTTEALKDLAQLISSSLRNLDLVTRRASSHFAFLLIETDESGAEVVWRRLQELFEDIDVKTRTGVLLEPRWEMRGWTDGSTELDDVMAFFRGGEDAS